MTSQKCQFGGAKVRLGDVAVINPKPPKDLNEEDQVSFLSLAAVNTDGSTTLGSPSCRKEVSKGHPWFVNGDILLAKITPSFENGKIAIADVSFPDGYSSTEFHVVRPIKDQINREYLLAFLRSKNVRSYCVGKMKGSAGQKRVPVEVLKNLYLPKIIISEQISIANQFAQIYTLIQESERIIASLDVLVKSRFVEMFVDRGFPTVKFGDYCEHVNNGMTRRGNDKDGSIVLRLVELQEGYIDYSKVNRIVLTGKERAKFLLHDCDILFARVNGNSDNVGRCAAFVDIGESVYHNDHIIRATVASGSFVSEYLVYYMNSPYGREQIDKSLKTSAGQYTINQEGVKDIYLPIPPLHLQQEFAAFVRQADKLRVLIQQQKEKLQMLYDSLAQEYFAV